MKSTEPAVLHDSLPAGKPLSGLVHRILTSVATEPGTFEIPLPPTGSIYLNALIRGKATFRFSDGTHAHAPKFYIGGQLLREIPIARIQTPLLLVGLQFSATGIHRLFRIDASKLTDRMTPLDVVDGELARYLSDALENVDRSAEAAKILQDILAGQLPNALAGGLAARAATRIEAQGGHIDVAELAESCGVTPRHLRRVFSREVGISPKAYAKTIQLNAVISALQSGEMDAMHQIALKHGYYDQAHFIRDFSRLVGNNPTDFLASRDPFLEMFLGRRSAG